MTMKELSQLHWLNVEIDRDKQRLAELEARATSPRWAEYVRDARWRWCGVER